MRFKIGKQSKKVHKIVTKQSELTRDRRKKVLKKTRKNIVSKKQSKPKKKEVISVISKNCAIVHYIDEMKIGGAHTMMCELFFAINLYYPKHRQIVLTAKADKFGDRIAKSYGIEYKVITKKQLTKKVSKYRPCVLFFHRLFRSKTSMYRDLYRGSYSIPVVNICHTNMMQLRMEKCSYIVAVSQQMCNKMKRDKWLRGIKKIPIVNGVNRSKYVDIEPREHGYGEDVFLTGRINNFNMWKYSDSWVRWVSKMKLPKKLVHEYLGGGNFVRRARKVAEKYSGNNEIVIPGRVTNFEKKISMIKSWDVFLYETNRDEGVSMAILESLASGVPVICSNHFGNKEIIENGINGYVFKERKEAQSILSMLCSNPNRLIDLKESTKKHFKKNLDAKHVAKKYVDIAERVLRK